MPTTRPEQDQATQPVQADEYQPLGRQEAPTNSDALHGDNADDNSGSGGNAHPSSSAQDKKAAKLETDSDTEAPITGPGVSGGSIGQVTL